MSNPFDQFDAQPRGIRNNNPLNITGSKWDGQTGTDGAFAQFDTPEAGRAAADANLQAYHRKHGINTISGVVNRWAPPNENDTPAYIAHVAQQTGMDPNQPIDMEDPAVRTKVLDAMQQHETGQKPSGNPFDQFDGAPSPAPAPQSAPLTGSSHNGGVTVQVGAPQPPAANPANPAMQAVGEAASGFAQPFQNLGHSVMESYRRTAADAKAPPKSVGGFFSGIGDIPRIASDLAATAGAPLQAAIRPIAGAVSRALPAPMATHVEWRHGIPGRYIDGKMTPEQARTALEGDINTSLQGARPSGVNLQASRAASIAQSPVAGRNLTQQVRAVTPQMPAPAIKPISMSVPELRAADNAAWAKVDASGYRFPKKDVQGVAADVRQIVDEAGPELYPEADRVARRIEQLSQRGDLTPAQANRLRGQIGEKLLQPGSTEASIGGQIKSRIDALIDTANDPSLAQARALHTRYLKTREVTQRLEDAGLNQSSSGTGGNSNAARQALKPLVKNKSTARMRNATPDEMKALKTVVNGSPGQNLLRAASAFDPFHGKIGAMFQGGLGVATHGLSAATIPLGVAATAGEKALAQRNIQKLLELLSTGGKAATSAPALTARGLIGGSVLAAPLVRQQGSHPSKPKASR